MPTDPCQSEVADKTLNTHRQYAILSIAGSQNLCQTFTRTLRKKVEPKWLHPGAVLENGAALEGGAVFSLNKLL